MPEEEAKQEEEVKQEPEAKVEAEEPEAKAEAEAPEAKPEEPEAKAEEPEAKPEAEEAKAEAPEAEAKPEEPKPKPEAKKPEAKAEEKKPEPKPEAKKPAKPVKRSPAIEDIMTKIKKMTVLELAELVQALQDEFGVSAAVPVAAAPAAAAPGGAAAAAPADEEKTEFTVVLKEVGANKISVIRAVRELTTLGLKEAKDFVESAPQTVKEGINKEEAATAKQKLEAAGATVEVK